MNGLLSYLGGSTIASVTVVLNAQFYVTGIFRDLTVDPNGSVQVVVGYPEFLDVSVRICLTNSLSLLSLCRYSSGLSAKTSTRAV